MNIVKRMFGIDTMIWGGYDWNLSWLFSCYRAALSRRESKTAWGLSLEAPIEGRYVVGQDENSTVCSIVCLILKALYSNIYLFPGLSVLATPWRLFLLNFSISHSRLQLTARMTGQKIWRGLVVSFINKSIGRCSAGRQRGDSCFSTSLFFNRGSKLLQGCCRPENRMRIQVWLRLSSSEIYHYFFVLKTSSILFVFVSWFFYPGCTLRALALIQTWTIFSQDSTLCNSCSSTNIHM